MSSAGPPAAEPGSGTAALADRVATATASVTGVAALRAGRFGEVATVLRGRRVDGVAVSAEAVDVHLAATMGTDLMDLADRVRDAVGELDRPVHVHIDEVVPPVAGDP